MDDERIERALRAGPANEPLYQPGLRTGAERRGRPPSFGWLRLLGVGIAAVLVVAAFAWLRAVPAPEPDVGGDLLADLRALGRIRIAVTSAQPQVEIPGVGIEGFDVDVARALGERLGLRVEIDFVDPAQVAAGDWQGRWDLAVDSAVATGQRAGVLDLGSGYYAKPGIVIVPEDSPVQGPADLTGRRICVQAGSLAELWLAGTLDLVGGREAGAPENVTVVTGSEDGCLAEVAAGTSDGFVGDWDYEVGAPPAGLRALSEPPFVGVAAPSVDPARPGSARLLEAVDQVFAALRADGTLRSLSERRFGGQDLTVLPD